MIITLKKDKFKVRKSDRLIMPRHRRVVIKSSPSIQQSATDKPEGIWYGIGDSWIDWCKSEMPQWLKSNLFKISLRKDAKVLFIHSEEDFLEFDDEFKVNLYKEEVTAMKHWVIDWRMVSKIYSGIEISPYFYKFRLDRNIHWYYTWDVASGYIWDENAIKSIAKIEPIDSLINKHG